MSTVAEQPNGRTTTIARSSETVITYVPLGEVEAISLTLSRVKQFLCIPTRSGKMPSDEQVVKYMMLCKAQSLNPWVNDAYLVGYDGKDGPQFSLITAHQSFLKRAEASPEFDGIESGVIVARDEAITERQGDLILNGETLVGAWARVHRRDRKIPSYDALNLKTFDTGRSRWAADPAGMIVKCAEASALRKAFPSTLAAMYCKEEMDRERESRDSVPHVDTRSKADRMASQLIGTQPAATPTQETEVEPSPATGGEPEPTRSQQRRQEAQQEQREEPPEQVTAMSFLDRIENAVNATALKTIMADANKALEQQQIEQHEHDQIASMAQEARSRCGK